MEIREVNEKDIEKIAMIEKACFPKEEAATYQEFLARYQSFKECYLVACQDHQIIGFINGCTTNQPCLPDELYHDSSLHQKDGAYQTVFGLDVLPQYQRQGVAAALLNAFIDLAKKRHKKGMILTCKDHLIHYYQKFGFVHQGVSVSCHGGAKWNDMLLEFEEL